MQIFHQQLSQEALGRPALNLSISGSTLFEQKLIRETALAAASVDTIHLGH